MNLYGYVLGDPVNLMDPFGLKNWGEIVGGGIILIGGTISTLAGGAIIGVGVVEAEIIVGAGLAPHTFGVGGTLIAVGVAISKIGWDLAKDGWKHEPCGK